MAETIAAVLTAIGPAPRRYPIEHKKGLLGHYTRYGPWKITYDPPPIPVRDCDWHFAHDDFDAELVDGQWHGNGLGGLCASFADALNECDEIEDEAEHPAPATAATSLPVAADKDTTNA